LFVVGISRFKKWFVVDVSHFQIELRYKFLGNFLLGHSFGYFSKNWAIVSDLLVTLAATVTVLGSSWATLSQCK
jgi:hypothetical protein